MNENNVHKNYKTDDIGEIFILCVLKTFFVNLAKLDVVS